MFGQGSGLSISPTGAGYQLVNQTFVSRSQSYYTYQAILVNNGVAVPSVTATVTSLSPAIGVVAGQGTVHFSPVPAHSSVVSTDTFTILVNGLFDPSQLVWSFNSPVANPGLNQTVAVLSVVTLNGGNSTDPGGIGPLTYRWSIQSAPGGSTATLSNANSMIATFTPDMIGTYVIALTVSNGSQTDTNTATISTTDAPPTANAGSSQTVAVGATVTLNGTQSFDVNNQPLSYTWSLISIPPGSTAVLFGRRSPTATFFVDKPGSYIAGLVVNDGTLNSPLATVTISTGNTAPVAVATATPQNVAINGVVQLDGSKSTDVDGNPLTFSWSLNTTQAPQSNAKLSNSNMVNPTFTADVAGTYVVQLIVFDGTVSSQPVTAVVTTNAVPAPTANAGSDQKVAIGALVQLQGSGTDPQNRPLSYTWSLPTVPTGSRAVLSATNIPNPTFTADLAGTYSAKLVVNNGLVSSNPAFVTVTSNSVAPVAVPTTSTPSIPVGSVASLNGMASFDPDGDPITGYNWSLTVPSGSAAALSRPNGSSPTFVPDVAGTYVAQLIVTDKFGSSSPATVSISAGQMTITMTPNPLILTTQSSALTITFSPATVIPTSVTLSGYDPSVISLSPNPIAVPANSTVVNVNVARVASGSTSVTASTPGYQSSMASVTVTLPTIAITMDGNVTSVGLNQSVGATITLSAPAPAFTGAMVSLVDVEDHDSGNIPGLVTFSPSLVVIPPGGTTGRFTITGTRVGGVEILPSAAGFPRAFVTVFDVTPGGL